MNRQRHAERCASGTGPANQLPRHGWLGSRQQPGQLPQRVQLRRLRRLSRAVARRLRRSGFLVPAALSLYLSAKGLHPELPGWSDPPPALTGLPSPTCSPTRATAAALSGDLELSLHLHAFGLPLAVLLLLWSLLAIRRRRFLPITIRGHSLAVAVVALLLYWLARLILQLGLGIAAFPTALAWPLGR